MNVGPLSNNWLFYKTMMDTAVLSRPGQIGSFGLQANSFQLLLEQLLLQQESARPPQMASAVRGFPVLPSASETGINPAAENVPHSGSPVVNNGIEAELLNGHLKGALHNAGSHFVEAGKKYEINPALLAAISIHETGNGSSNAARFKFNVAGMMGKNGLKTYASVEDSIFDMARNLRQNYLDEGKTTIAQIGAKYAPIGAANDPTNLNNHWVNGVTKQYAALNAETGLG